MVKISISSIVSTALLLASSAPLARVESARAASGDCSFGVGFQCTPKDLTKRPVTVESTDVVLALHFQNPQPVTACKKSYVPAYRQYSFTVKGFAVIAVATGLAGDFYLCSIPHNADYDCYCT